ncbi:MAG: hypothetical protein A2X94_17700 [Bdellovibrionales bacterium GWB1_55_8]|nr:MAG: hypothetical protein A2X94_17700 [Bdellovibrionales bacterium GWB1_55_8]
MLFVGGARFSLLLAGALCGLSACRPEIYGLEDTQSVTHEPAKWTGSLEGHRLPKGILSASIVNVPQERTIDFFDIRTGGFYDVEITQNGAKLDELNCSTEATGVGFWTESNRIHLDFTQAPAPGSVALRCNVGGGFFATVTFHLLTSPVAVISPRSQILDPVGVVLLSVRSSTFSPDLRFISFIGLLRGIGQQQYFVKDLKTGSLRIASSASDGSFANSGVYNGASTPDGQFAVFESNANNLDGNQSVRQIFLKDMNGSSVRVISSGANGKANADCRFPKISDDARFVLFESTATNLINGVSGRQLYLKDTQTGGLTLVSSLDGTPATADDSDLENSSMTPDGKFAVFTSWATNFFPGVNANGQVYRKNLVTGEMTLVSSVDGTSATSGEDYSGMPVISSDGKIVYFTSWATNFIAGASAGQIYRKDLESGTITLVSSLDGSVTTQSDSDDQQVISLSSTGDSIALVSRATNWGNSDGIRHLYIKNMNTGALSLASTAKDGSPGNQDVWNAAISSGGDAVFFESQATNLAAGATSGTVALFKKSIQTNEIEAVALVYGTTLAQSLSPQSVSSDGRQLLLSGAASIYPELSVKNHLFLKNLQAGTLSVIDALGSGAAGVADADSVALDMTPDGRYVLFSSAATNLAPSSLPADGLSQIYRKDTVTGEMVLVSSLDGSVANRSNGSCNYLGRISGNANIVFMTCDATNLIAGVSGPKVYSKNLTSQSITLVSTSNGLTSGAFNATATAATPDARYVLLVSNACAAQPCSGSSVYRRDMSTGEMLLVNSRDGTSATWFWGPFTPYSRAWGISDDGNTALFETSYPQVISGIFGWQLYIKNLTLQSFKLVTESFDGSTGHSQNSNNGVRRAQLSSDGQLATFISSASNLCSSDQDSTASCYYPLLIKDLTTRDLRLVSSLDGSVTTSAAEVKSFATTPAADRFYMDVKAPSWLGLFDFQLYATPQP